MSRQDLLDQLAHHQSYDEVEAESLARMVEFVREYEECFERSLLVGHMTGATWLLDRGGERALLTHHRKLDMWLQLGGHCDGDADTLAVALREAQEESGISGIVPVSRNIFDVDVHAIPARGQVPAHVHYDVRYLVRTTVSDDFTVSEESHDLRWVTVDELAGLEVDESVRRMGRKWQAWRTAPA